MSTTLKRNSGVELLRFLSITFILGIHMITLIIGAPYTSELMERPTQTLGLVSFESLFIVCVDIFVIISGWFEIHASSKGLIKLMFQCVFFAIVDMSLSIMIGTGDFTFARLGKILITGCFPGWFIAAYIILYLVSPIVNQFVNNSSKRTVSNLVITMFVILLMYGWLFNGCSGNASTFISGYSATFLIFLYTGVRCIKVHYNDSISRLTKAFWLKTFISLFLLDILIWVISAYLSIGAVNSKIFLYTSPIVILQSFSMFMFFLKLDFHCKFVNWLGASSLSIMLLHWSCNGYVFKSMSNYVWNSTNGLVCLVMLLSIIIAVSLCAIIIDQLRILVYNLIMKRLNIKSIKF